MNNDILKNLNNIRKNILNICKKVNRNPKEINIVAVSKKQELHKIKLLVNSGHDCFGENRLDESVSKWKKIEKDKIRLHFIGALQSKKVKDIVNNFNVIETLDTENSAKKLANYIFNNAVKPPKLFIQINIGNEKQKRGILVAQVESFLAMCREKYKLVINGAMCMPPKNQNPEKYFKTLKEICEKNNLTSISMGMSSDYEKAIELGANNIRIGTVIFGARE